MKKILWLRELSCGHSRPMDIAFISGNYTKPKIGDMCYCRDCCKDVKVIGVKEI